MSLPRAIAPRSTSAQSKGSRATQDCFLSSHGTRLTGRRFIEWLGKPTGSAMPLMWAHAEYIKLLRSTADGKVYDAIPEVAERYLGKRNDRTTLEVWKPYAACSIHARWRSIARARGCTVYAPLVKR